MIKKTHSGSFKQATFFYTLNPNISHRTNGNYEKEIKRGDHHYGKEKIIRCIDRGSILLILGIVLAVITHNNSYQESVAYGSQLSDVKAQLEEVEASIEQSPAAQQTVIWMP